MITLEGTGLWARVRDVRCHPRSLFLSGVLLLSVHTASSDFCSFNFRIERKGATGGEEEFGQEHSEE